MSERPERTVEEENEVEKAKALTRVRDRARLFREAFGSARGALVLDEIRRAFRYGEGIPKNILDAHDRTDALQTHRKLGEYSVIRWIEIQLEWKESDYVNPSSGST
jgi:transposase